jgi:phosphopentomutase
LRRAAFTRVILLVIDSAGVGELPDAAAYGDEGSNTLGNIAAQVGLAVPFLRSLGLGRVVALDQGAPGDGTPRGAFGRMAEASPGKDSVTGHWEMAGVVLDRPFPTFPTGFSSEVMREFERRIGRGTLGNEVASGTEIIDRLGDEHVRSGKPIVYTSADSVFQIAAHEEVIPIAEQYRMCEDAFDLVGRGLGVGRVIARPFVGGPGAYRRTANRHDYALEPTGVTLLDALTADGQRVVTIGKVRDLFAGRGITQALPTVSDADGIAALKRALDDVAGGLVFVNLVDSDTQYGHRNDVRGYAANLERIDAGLAEATRALRPGDLFVVTADHGNDPTTPSTDHSREYVPVLLAGDGVRAGHDLGTRATYADLGQTIAENFGVGPLAHGTSFLGELLAGGGGR